MYKVIIVEDELFVRLGIKNTIAWEQYDMQVICDAENGQTAWEEIQRYRPDVILTDILMPVMDGQQLIEKIQGLPYDPYVIVITCLQDFNMVRKLLSNGIHDYLLKATMTDEEISNCLKKAQRFLERENTHCIGTDVENYTSRWDRCNRGIELYLQDKLSPAQLTEALDPSGISPGFSTLFLSLCPIEAVYDYQGNSISFPMRHLYRNLSDLLRDRSYEGGTLHSFFVYEKYFILILSSAAEGSLDEKKGRALDCFRAIHDDAQDLLHIDISFLICVSENGLDGLKSSFRQSLKALDRHYLDGKNSVVCCWNNDLSQKIKAAEKELDTEAEWIGKRLGESAKEHYCGFVREFVQNAPKSKEDVVCSLMTISHYICSFCRGNLDDEEKQCDKLLIRYPYLTEEISSLVAFLRSCEQYLAQYQSSHHYKELEKAIRIIDEKLDQPDLSVRSVCAQIGYSEAYFSAFFHQKMQMSPSKYIANERIKRAKYLLEHTDDKLYQVAARVGYKDDTYFSRVFKKATGISPSEWRSLWKL